MKLFLKYAEDILPTWPTTSLDEMKIVYDKNIMPGEILITSMIKEELFEKLRKKLYEQGFTILHDGKDILVQKIKYVVYSMLEMNELPKINTFRYISNHLHLNYTFLANIFSRTEGMTIERFIICKRSKKQNGCCFFMNMKLSRWL